MGHWEEGRGGLPVDMSHHSPKLLSFLLGLELRTQEGGPNSLLDFDLAVKVDS